MPNKRGGPNKWAGWADFFIILLHKNQWRGPGRQIFRLLHGKQ